MLGPEPHRLNKSLKSWFPPSLCDWKLNRNGDDPALPVDVLRPFDSLESGVLLLQPGNPPYLEGDCPPDDALGGLNVPSPESWKGGGPDGLPPLQPQPPWHPKFCTENWEKKGTICSGQETLVIWERLMANADLAKLGTVFDNKSTIIRSGFYNVPSEYKQ